MIFFLDYGKNSLTDKMCISDDSKVTVVDENMAIFSDYAVLLHGEFVERVMYYLQNFSVDFCHEGMFVSLAPPSYSKKF